jgi:putative phosphoribosyl transferase
MTEPFDNRQHAGIALALMLGHYAANQDVVVLALPRGGVPVAREVAKALGAPLDVFLVRKLGVPGHPELAMGAIASGGVRVLNEDVLRWYGISPGTVDAVALVEGAELERRDRAYRKGQPLLDLNGRIVILVDDGLATGSTMKAAVAAVRRLAPARVVVAVPVAARTACAELAAVSDEMVCGRTPESFSSVGQWYRDFSQTSDDDVRALLEARAQPAPPRRSPAV